MNNSRNKNSGNVSRLKYLKRAMLYRRKWVSTEKWYNPLTWGRGYYEKVGGAK